MRYSLILWPIIQDWKCSKPTTTQKKTEKYKVDEVMNLILYVV